MPCSTSGCDNEKVFARGLCQGCYYRLRRNGSVERKYVVNSGTCSHHDCKRHAFAKNLCELHYRRSQHPLKNLWQTFRSRHHGDYPLAWGRFSSFLADVGERPSPKHQLRRIDGSRPYSASNVHWLPPIGEPRDYYTPEKRSEYARAWNLRDSFGLTVAQYQAMFDAQGGKCASCTEKETQRLRSGKLKELSVDHDHKTGKVRGLLCVKCNRGIGYFDDNPTLLRSAAAYLERHQPANDN